MLLAGLKEFVVFGVIPLVVLHVFVHFRFLRPMQKQNSLKTEFWQVYSDVDVQDGDTAAQYWYRRCSK